MEGGSPQLACDVGIGMVRVDPAELSRYGRACVASLRRMLGLADDHYIRQSWIGTTLG